MEQLPAGVTRVDHPVPHYEIRTAACDADVYDLGAQLGRWAPAGQGDVVWLSPRATFTVGKAIRGGVPICWPWFGPGKPGQPAHGIARTALWRPLGVAETDRGIEVAYLLDPALLPAEHRPLVPADARVTARITVGETARVAVEIAAGAEPVECEIALHTYLGVSDVEAVEVRGLAGVGYLDQPTGDHGTDPGPLHPSGEIDRLYAASGEVTLVDTRREVVVRPEGAAQTVVWTPGEAKAATLGDLGDAYRGFLAVETLCAREHALRIAPGQSRTVATVVSVRA